MKKQKAAALKYQEGEDEAPKLSAKGQGVIAEKIIEIAKEYNIPIKEDSSLVEILMALELNQEIPNHIYEAVALILSEVLNMDKEYAVIK